MAKVSECSGDYLLLPRPWMKNHELPICASNEQSRKAPLYVRGDAIVGGKSFRLAYWHKVVWVGNVES